MSFGIESKLFGNSSCRTVIVSDLFNKNDRTGYEGRNLCEIKGMIEFRFIICFKILGIQISWSLYFGDIDAKC